MLVHRRAAQGVEVGLAGYRKVNHQRPLDVAYIHHK